MENILRIIYNKRIYVTVLIAGLLIHGYALFNEIAYHDAASYATGSPNGIPLNRFMLNVVSWIEKYCLGLGNFESTAWNGALMLIIIASGCSVICSLFCINDSIHQIIFACIMVAIPSVASLYGYKVCGVYFELAMYEAIWSAYLVCKTHNWKGFCAASALLTLSLGTYQAYLPLYISTVLLYIITQIYSNIEFDKALIIRKIMYFVGITLAGFTLYLVMSKVFRMETNTQISSYAGIDKAVSLPISTYLYRIIVAYGEFVFPAPGYSFNIYPGTILIAYYFVLGVVVISAFLMLKQVWNDNKQRAIFLLICFLAAPLALNFIFVMAHASVVHALMYYSQIVVFLFVLWGIEKIRTKKNYFKYLGIVGCCWIIIMFARFDNICYQKAIYLQEECKQYCTILAGRIQSVDGYEDDMPVVYVNEFEKKDKNLTYFDKWEKITINPYRDSTLINNYNWKTFMKLWCGFDPEVVDEVDFENLTDVVNMKSYPADGSIRIVNGTIVVKF